MDEAFVQLLCPECTKSWEANPTELPQVRETYRCPDCNHTRQTAEFMRTERDLETLKRIG